MLGLLEPELLGEPSRRTVAKRRNRAAFQSTEALSLVGEFGGYSTYAPPGNTDKWVERAMDTFLPVTDQNTLRGWTRRHQGAAGMQKSLEKFGGRVSRFTDLSRPQRSAMVAAIGKARTAFSVPYKVQPLDLEKVGQHMKTETSAGFSFPGKKKSDVMPEIYSKARWLQHRIKHGGLKSFNPKQVQFPPCLAGARGHMSPSDDPKTRLIWVYPAEMLAIEGKFAPLIYDLIANKPDGPLLLGNGSHRLFSEWMSHYQEGKELYGLDFSAFDTKVPPWLIHVAFDILHHCLDWDNYGNVPSSKKWKQKNKNLWDAVKWYFINTPILMPDGRLFRKHHGVPSGTYFTQLIDSVVNYIIIQYVCNCQQIEPEYLRVLGDDSQFMSALSLDLNRAQSDCDALNMLIKVEKCERTKDPTQFKSLGLRYKDGHGYRETEEWFRFAIYPEQPPQSVEVSMSRLVGLWLGGGMFDKVFCKFFDYYQSCYPCPSHGLFSKEQRKWMSIIFGGRAPRGWSKENDLFWRSIFYCL